MDNSKEFQLMLNRAIISEPFAFVDFDRTKNVQDQLQEMLSDRYEEKYDMCSMFAAYLFDKPDIMSMEQLWLGFVQKENDNKVWNGKEWS